MKFALKAAALASALTVGFGSAIAQDTTVETTPEAPVAAAPAAEAPAAFANPFDISTWFDGTDGMDVAELGQPEAVNPAAPAFWMSFINPETHTKRHMQFTNPAQYAQFLSPGFYMQFANPQNWLAWVNPNSYAVLADTDTYTYWMQPGAYAHVLKADGYMQVANLDNYEAFTNPATYLQWMSPEAYDIDEVVEGTAGALSLMNPASWTGVFQTASN